MKRKQGKIETNRQSESLLKMFSLEQEQFKQTELKLKALEKFYVSLKRDNTKDSMYLSNIVKQKQYFDKMNIENIQDNPSNLIATLTRKLSSEEIEFQDLRKQKSAHINLEIENQQLRLKQKGISEKVRNQRLMNYRINKFDDEKKIQKKNKQKELILLQEELTLLQEINKIQEYLKNIKL